MCTVRRDESRYEFGWGLSEVSGMLVITNCPYGFKDILVPEKKIRHPNPIKKSGFYHKMTLKSGC